jgi:hypothetical protein
MFLVVSMTFMGITIGDDGPDTTPVPLNDPYPNMPTSEVGEEPMKAPPEDSLYTEAYPDGTQSNTGSGSWTNPKAEAEPSGTATNARCSGFHSGAHHV